MVAATLVFLLHVSALYEVGLRTEGRTQPATIGAEQPTRAELSVEPRLLLTQPLQASAVAISYSPRLLFTPSSDHVVDALHRANLLATTSSDRRTQWLLSAAASYGQNDYSLVTGTPPPAGGIATPGTALPNALGGRPPETRLVRVLDATAFGGFRWQTTRDGALEAGAGYQLSGGLDSLAQESVPQQRGPVARLGYSWTYGSSDRWSLLSTGSRRSFSLGRDTWLVDLIGSWTTFPLRPLEVALSAGAGGYSTRMAGDQRSGVIPMGSAAVSYTAPVGGDRLVGSLRSSVAPTIDRLTGEAVTRADGSLALRWHRGHLMAVECRLSGFWTLTGVDVAGERTLQGELSGEWNFDTRTAVNAGLRVAQLSSPRLTDGPATQWMLFVAYTVGAGGRL